MTSKQPDICIPRMWMWCVHLPRFDNVSVLPARSTGWAFLAIRPCHLSIISSSRSQFSIDEITQGPRHALANHCLRERGSDWSNFEDTLKPGASISPPYPCIIHMFSRPHRTLEDGDKRFDGRELGLFLETSSKPCLVLLSHIVSCHSIDQSDHKQASHSVPTHGMPRSWSRPWICSKETKQCKKRQTWVSQDIL